MLCSTHALCYLLLPMQLLISHLQAPAVVSGSHEAAAVEHNVTASDSEADESDAESYASSSEAMSEEISSRLSSHAGAGTRKLGSIASTYWRPERLDRKENLSVIDERYD